MKTVNNYMNLMIDSINKREKNNDGGIPGKVDQGNKFKGRIINIFTGFDSKMSTEVIERLLQWEEEDLQRMRDNAQLKNPVPVEQLLEPITINISSYGGYVHELMAIVDILRGMPAPIITKAIGKCMSCAFVLFCIGDVRLVGPNCDLLYHQISGMAYGKHRDVIEQLESMHIDQQRIDDLVLERTNLTQEQLDEWNKMKQDRHITAEEAMEWGIATDLLYEIRYVEEEEEKPKEKKKSTKGKSKSTNKKSKKEKEESSKSKDKEKVEDKPKSVRSRKKKEESDK